MTDREARPSLQARPELSPRAARRWLLALFVAALLLRGGVVAWIGDGPPAIFDEKDYDKLAVNLATTGRYAFETNGRLSSLRPPLYPAFVAGVYALFGVRNYLAVRVLQVLLGAGTILPLYVLAKRMFSARTALWAAGFVACYPELVGFSALLLSETLCTFLLVLACLAMQQLLIDGRLRSAALLGVALGLAALTRSVVLPFVPLAMLFAFCVLRQRTWWQRGAAAAVVAVACAAVVAPWAIRNTQLEKSFTTIDSMGGRNLMMGNYEFTPMYRSWDTISIRQNSDKSWDRVLAAKHAKFSTLTQGQRDKLAMQYGRQFMLAHPGLTLTRSLVKFFDFWQLDRTLIAGLKKSLWGPVPTATILALAVVFCGSYVFAVLTGIYGFVTRRPADMRMHYFLLLMVGFVCFTHAVVFAHARYRLPLLPFVLIYAASALSAPRSPGGPGKASSWLGAGLALALIISWIVRLIAADIGEVVADRHQTGRPSIACYERNLVERAGPNDTRNDGEVARASSSGL